MKITGIHQILIMASAFALTLIARSEPEPASKRSLKLDDLPSAVQSSLQHRIEGSSIIEIVIKPPVYCAQLNANGQISEVRVAEDGTILRVRSKQEAEAQFEREERLSRAGKLNTVALENVPDVARTIITKRSEGLTISRIVKTPVIFVVRIDRAGEKIEIQLTDDGKIVGDSST